MCSGEGLADYGAVMFGGEPSYGCIRGRWLSDRPYVVLHRLAVAEGMKGRDVGARFMAEVEKMAAARGVRSFKVDTNHDNTRMRRLLGKLGTAATFHTSTATAWPTKNCCKAATA